MTFIVNGMKEGFNKTYKIDFLVGTDSLLLAKKLLEDTGIIVLSLKEYKEKNESFGNIAFSVFYQQKDIALVSNFQGTLQQACVFLLAAGFKMTKINFFKNSISEEEAKITLQQAIQEDQKRKAAENQTVEQAKEKEKKIYADKRLDTDKKTIERLLIRMEEVIRLTEGKNSGRDLKSLKDKSEELKKQKLGTNHESIRALVEDISTILDGMENDFYQNTAKSTPIGPDSIVTDSEVTWELKKLEKIKKIKEMGGYISVADRDYLLLDKYKILQKFITKDIVHFFTTPTLLTNMLYSSYELVELGVMMTIIGVIFSIFYSNIFGLGANHLYPKLIGTGLFGGLIFGTRWARKKNIYLLIVYLPIIIVIYYMLMGFIKNNLSI